AGIGSLKSSPNVRLRSKLARTPPTSRWLKTCPSVHSGWARRTVKTARRSACCRRGSRWRSAIEPKPGLDGMLLHLYLADELEVDATVSIGGERRATHTRGRRLRRACTMLCNFW